MDGSEAWILTPTIWNSRFRGPLPIGIAGGSAGVERQLIIRDQLSAGLFPRVGRGVPYEIVLRERPLSEPLDGRGKALRVASHEDAERVVTDHFRGAPDARADDGGSAREGLEEHIGPSLLTGGEAERVGRAIPEREPLRGLLP